MFSKIKLFFKRKASKSVSKTAKTKSKQIKKTVSHSTKKSESVLKAVAKKTSAPTESTTHYFSSEKAQLLSEHINGYLGISVEKFGVVDGNVFSVEFSREKKFYTARFEVLPEANGFSYTMRAELISDKKKSVFKKERTGLDYSQVEPALMFVFHQTFNDI